MRTRSSVARPRVPRLHLHIKLRCRRVRFGIESVSNKRRQRHLPTSIRTTRQITMKITLTVVFFCVLVLVNCQDYGFDDFPNYAFSGGFDAPSQNVRDPRNDRGPVIFPQVPLDNGQGSGVIAGASGYGFVPPRQGSRSSSLY